MPLPDAPLATICDKVREHVSKLGEDPIPANWDVTVNVGSPGDNFSSGYTKNSINLFFYRFEPSGLNAVAKPGDIQWLKIMCLITAFGFNSDSGNASESGISELKMLSEVIRLFQEQPVMFVEDNSTSVQGWHLQFIHLPITDEQISQLWSTQGDTIFRPSLVYEIVLAPIKPQISSMDAPRVGSIGTHALGSASNRYTKWPVEKAMQYPQVPPLVVNTDNPQWAPAIAIIDAAEDNRIARFSMNIEIEHPVRRNKIPDIAVWLGGAEGNALHLTGQLLQTPGIGNDTGRWQEIQIGDGLFADSTSLDVQNPPANTNFTLRKRHWNVFERGNNSWQLQLFAERYLKLDRSSGVWVDAELDESEIRIRSNPVLITLTVQVP